MLAVALVASLTALVVVRQDRDDLAEQVAALQSQGAADERPDRPTGQDPPADRPERRENHSSLALCFRFHVRGARSLGDDLNVALEPGAR